MKKRILAVLTTAVLCMALVLTACGGTDTEKTAKDFSAAVEELALPVTKDSADAINGAYTVYYGLSEAEQRAAQDAKAKLDGYAALCNGIISVIYNAGEIGDYTVYSAYTQKVDAALAAYDALIKLDASYASDADVTAAKKTIDGAKTVVDEKNAQIDAYIQAVEAVGEYNNAETLYTEWTGKIADAQDKYTQISSAEDDIRSLERVAEARVALRADLAKKEELDVKIADFDAKVEAAGQAYDLAFGEGAPFYDEIVNAAFDEAENAYIVAQAANLTADAVTEASRTAWTALGAKYNGVRFATDFESDMNGVEAMLTLPSTADALEEKLAAAEEHYAKIPEADRENVAELKALLDQAKEKLPELKAEKAFLDAVAAIDYNIFASLEEAETAVQDARTNWQTLVDTYGYESGIGEVDDAKAAFDAKAEELTVLTEFIRAAGEIPPVEEIVADKETHDKITAADEAYEVLTETQRMYPIVVSANILRTSADEKMESLKSDMFSVPAYDKDGEAVEAGMKTLSFDQETGLISGVGSRANYLQVLYTVASRMPEHKVNGVVIDETNSANVDAEAVQKYMKENFEYVFSVYNGKGAKVGEVRKDVVYDESAQVPALAELQPYFPVYHNEDDQVDYGFGFSVAVKEDATDEQLHYIIRNSESVHSEEFGTITGDKSKQNMLSPANLIALENMTGGGTIQIMRKDGVVCAQGKALNYKYVGAYDLYFYEGEEVAEDNLIEWFRTVKETGTAKEGTYVRNFRGSSLVEKGFENTMMTDKEYIAAGVEDVTATVEGASGAHKAHGWMISGEKGFTNAWTRVNVLIKLFNALGYQIPTGTTITIVARLRVNQAGIEAGIQDSPLSEAIRVTF